MRKIIFFFIFLSAVQGYSQDSRYSIHVFGGGSISLLDQNIYSENISIDNSSLLPRFSGTENIRFYFKLIKSIHFIVGYGHSRTGARPSFYVSDSTFNNHFSVNDLHDFTYAIDLGVNFRVIETKKWNVNTSVSYSIGESRYGLRGNSSYINFGDTLVFSKYSYLGDKEELFSSYRSLKFSLGTEYKLGEAKTSAITFDLFFNQGFRELSTALADTRINDKYIRANIINRGSYVSFTLGFKKFFALRPVLNK